MSQRENFVDQILSLEFVRKVFVSSPPKSIQPFKVCSHNTGCSLGESSSSIIILRLSDHCFMNGKLAFFNIYLWATDSCNIRPIPLFSGTHPRHTHRHSIHRNIHNKKLRTHPIMRALFRCGLGARVWYWRRIIWISKLTKSCQGIVLSRAGLLPCSLLLQTSC